MKYLKQNKLAVFIALVVIASLGQILWSTHESRENSERLNRITTCQTNQNEQFLRTLQSRAKINDRDREIVKIFVDELYAAKTPEDSQRARGNYNREYDKLQEERDKFMYPTVVNC